MPSERILSEWIPCNWIPSNQIIKWLNPKQLNPWHQNSFLVTESQVIVSPEEKYAMTESQVPESKFT